jgi:chromosome segregation ATPase
MSAQTDRLSAIKNELNNLLEAQIGDLLGAVRATQEITRRLVSTEEEIRRQTLLKEGLEAQLGPLKSRADGLTAENRDLQARVDRLRENVERMKSLRDELMSNLSNLKGEIGDE